jgi:hypothetical protein
LIPDYAEGWHAERAGAPHFDSFQESVGRWCDEAPGSPFRESRNEAIAAHLHDEALEFDEALSPEEAADVLLVLCHLTHRFRVSLDRETGNWALGVSAPRVEVPAWWLRMAVEELARPVAEHDRAGVAYYGGYIAFLLWHWCRNQGFDLMSEAARKWEVAKNRTWGPPDERGVRHHV